MFVGRATELERVDDLLGSASEGHGALLRIIGEPGVGKTELLAAAVRRARRRGLQTAAVRVVRRRGGSPLEPVEDLLRALGATSCAMESGDAATAQLLDALTGWVADRPSLITIDDLPAADAESVHTVASAAARAAGLPLVVLATARSDEPADPHAEGVWAVWPSLRLRPLGPLAAAALVRSALGPGADERTVEALVDARHGNPGALVDTASLLSTDEAAGAAPLPDPLPMSPATSAAWIRLLDDLPAATRDAVGVVAVMPHSDRGLLADVLASVGRTVGDLGPAEDAGLVRHDDRDRAALSQPLLADAIVASSPAPGRRDLHRAAARAAARLRLAPSVVVDHLVAATDRPDPDIADALADQATRSRDLGDAHGAARAQYWAARLTVDPEARRSRIIGAVRDRLECVNDAREIVPLLDLVRADQRTELDVGAWVSWLRAAIEPDLSIAAATESMAIEEARAHSPALLPELLSSAIDSAWAMGDPQSAMAAIDELDLLARSGVHARGHEPTWQADALRAAGLFQLGQVAAATALRRRVLEEADRLDPAGCDPDLLMSAVHLDDLLLADTPGSRARMAAALQRCPTGTPLTPCLWGMAAWQARARGDWTAARLLVNDGLTLCRELSAVWPLDGLLALSVELAALQGDGDLLERHGTALREFGLRTADRRRLAVLDRAQALAALAAGSLDAAAAGFAEAADVGFLGRGLRDAVIPSRVDLVDVLRRLDRLPEARARARALHPVLAAMDDPLAPAWDARVTALVSEGEEVDRHFDAALVAHAAAPDRFEEGRTELLYGEHLRRTRRRARARGHLARAETLFERMRATPWLQRARQELRVAGSPRGTDTAWRRALTAQEANVAEAVSRGRTTREVAELLVLSPRTVETHLSSVYRKLGVTGRTGLAGVLAGDGTTARSPHP